MRTKLRKIDDGSVQDKTFRAGEKFRPVRTESRKMQYLYDSGDAAVFMDSSDYEQIEIPSDVVGDAMRWLLPNAEVDVLFVDERPSDVQVPSAVDMKVTTTEPGVKGDTASGGGSKPATLESGVSVQVPLFIEEGEVDPDRHPQRRVRLPRLAHAVRDPTNAATPSSPATSATSPGARSRS